VKEQLKSQRIKSQSKFYFSWCISV